MPPTPPNRPLGRQLLATLSDVNALYAKAATREDIERLDAIRSRLLDQLGTLVDRNLDSGSREYAAATLGLQNASAQINDALQRLDRVAQAITVLGQALDMVAKLAV